MYHFDRNPVTIFPTCFPRRNSDTCHHETNIIPYLATFENSWEKLIIRANFWVIRGLTASHDPKICTHCECFPHSFSQTRVFGKRYMCHSHEALESLHQSYPLFQCPITCPKERDPIMAVPLSHQPMIRQLDTSYHTANLIYTGSNVRIPTPANSTKFRLEVTRNLTGLQS